MGMLQHLNPQLTQPPLHLRQAGAVGIQLCGMWQCCFAIQLLTAIMEVALFCHEVSKHRRHALEPEHVMPRATEIASFEADVSIISHHPRWAALMLAAAACFLSSSCH